MCSSFAFFSPLAGAVLSRTGILEAGAGTTLSRLVFYVIFPSYFALHVAEHLDIKEMTVWPLFVFGAGNIVLGFLVGYKKLSTL